MCRGRTGCEEKVMKIIQTELTSPELLKLFDEHDAYMMDFLGEDRKYYTPYSENERIGRAWIVYADGCPAGCTAYREKDEGTGELKRVFLRAEYRGRGISKALVETVESYAREQGCRTLFLDTNSELEPAVSLYRRMGFQVVFQQGRYIQMEKGIQ